MRILDLEDGDLFMLRHDRNTVYAKLRSVTDESGAYTNVLVSAVLRRVDGEWRHTESGEENCNHLARVLTVKLETNEP